MVHCVPDHVRPRPRPVPAVSFGSASIPATASSRACAWPPHGRRHDRSRPSTCVRRMRVKCAPEMLHQAGRPPVPARRDPNRSEPESRARKVEAGSPTTQSEGRGGPPNLKSVSLCGSAMPTACQESGWVENHLSGDVDVEEPIAVGRVGGHQRSLEADRSPNKTAFAQPDASHRTRVGPSSPPRDERPRRRRSPRDGPAACRLRQGSARASP